MGKLVILSITDCEEHIINKIMELIADEPEFIHLAPSPPQSALSFPGLEIRLKEQTVYCNSTLITLTYHEFAVLTYLARHPGWVFSAHQIYEAASTPKTTERFTTANIANMSSISNHGLRRFL